MCFTQMKGNTPGPLLAAVLGLVPASLMAMAAIFRSGAEPLRFTMPADSICVQHCTSVKPRLISEPYFKPCGWWAQIARNHHLWCKAHSSGEPRTGNQSCRVHAWRLGRRRDASSRAAGGCRVEGAAPRPKGTGMLAARPASRKCTGCDRNPEPCWDRKTDCGHSTGTIPCGQGSSC